MSIRITLRDDQAEFIVSAMEFLRDSANERINNAASDPLSKFFARRSAERANEIRAAIIASTAKAKGEAS